MSNEKANKERSTKEQNQLMKSAEDILSELRPVDDIFFHKLAERQEFCEELLQTIL